MSQVPDLFRLQTIDTQKDQALNRLRSIEQILQQDLTLRSARDARQSADDDHRKAADALKDLETKVRAQSVKIEQAESALYGGSVRNPKELQELQQEIASLKRHLAVLEERQLEAMVDSDEKTAALRQTEADLVRVETELAAQHAALFQERDHLAVELKRLEAERTVTSGAIPPDWTARYDRLRRDRKGVAVAVILEDCCSACGNELTPSERQSARSLSTPFFCPSCGRFLYAG